MTMEEPRIEHPPLKLRRHRRVLFPDMIEIKLPRRRPKRPEPTHAPAARPVTPEAPSRPAHTARPAPQRKDSAPAAAVAPRTTAATDAADRYRPMYWRLLRLHHIRPNGWLRALFVEGSVALAAVLVLAEAASIWTILALPVAVAVLVKANDLVAGALRDSGDVDP
jgi:hypothetical protein